MSNKKEVVLSVEGMTCSSCVRHVESALRELEGIDAIEVSSTDGNVRVEHDPSRATIDEMVQALGEAGYEARGLGI